MTLNALKEQLEQIRGMSVNFNKKAINLFDMECLTRNERIFWKRRVKIHTKRIALINELLKNLN